MAVVDDAMENTEFVKASRFSTQSKPRTEQLVQQLINKPSPKPVAEAAKAPGDNVWDVPKLLASSASCTAWGFGIAPLKNA